MADLATHEQKALLNALHRADQVAPLWADNYRQEAEKRMGVEAGDMAVLDDPEYNRVLDAMRAVHEAHELVKAVTRWGDERCGQ